MFAQSVSSEVVHQDETLVILVRRHVLALAWYDAPRAGQLSVVLATMKSMRRELEAPTLMINVVVSGTPSFPEPVRDEGARLVRETSTFRNHAAHIIEVPGLAGAATRMFLSTMLLAGGGRTAHNRAFGEVEPACAWLAEQVTPPTPAWTAGELVQFYRALKQTPRRR